MGMLDGGLMGMACYHKKALRWYVGKNKIFDIVKNPDLTLACGNYVNVRDVLSPGS
jgi:hypothetical protein